MKGVLQVVLLLTVACHNVLCSGQVVVSARESGSSETGRPSSTRYVTAYKSHFKHDSKYPKVHPVYPQKNKNNAREFRVEAANRRQFNAYDSIDQQATSYEHNSAIPSPSQSSFTGHTSPAAAPASHNFEIYEAPSPAASNAGGFSPSVSYNTPSAPAATGPSPSVSYNSPSAPAASGPAPSVSYNSPSAPSPPVSYNAPSAPTGASQPTQPVGPSNSYETPPSDIYGAPPSTSYGSPQAPSTSYGSPQAPAVSNDPPPSTAYGSPPSTSYGSPQAPSTSYGSPPSTSYGSPPSTSYGSPPSADYASPPSTSYVSPPTTTYGITTDPEKKLHKFKLGPILVLYILFCLMLVFIFLRVGFFKQVGQAGNFRHYIDPMMDALSLASSPNIDINTATNNLLKALSGFISKSSAAEVTQRMKQR